MYTKLFKVLRTDCNQPITKPLLRKMGMKVVRGRKKDLHDVYYGEDFHSNDFSINVYYTETVLDIVENIIESDTAEYADECRVMSEGYDW